MKLKPTIGRAIPAAPAALAVHHFDTLPDSAGARASTVTAVIGISNSTLWRRVQDGSLPKPYKLGGCTFWNVGELRRAISALRGAQVAQEVAQ